MKLICNKWGIVAQWVQSFSYAGEISSRNLLYNTLSTVNNMPSCTLKYVKSIELMLSVLVTKTKPNNKKNHKRTQGNF